MLPKTQYQMSSALPNKNNNIYSYMQKNYFNEFVSEYRATYVHETNGILFHSFFIALILDVKVE